MIPCNAYFNQLKWRIIKTHAKNNTFCSVRSRKNLGYSRQYGCSSTDYSCFIVGFVLGHWSIFIRNYGLVDIPVVRFVIQLVLATFAENNYYPMVVYEYRLYQRYLGYRYLSWCSYSSA